MFDFDNEVFKGKKVQFEIKFIGQLNDKMVGFYCLIYKKEDGFQGFFVVSQMEFIDVCCFFFCFDEFLFKVEFIVIFIVDKNLICFSNMDVFGEIEVQLKQINVVKKVVIFNKLLFMFIYFVVFVVGELNYIEINEFCVFVCVYVFFG